MLVVTTAVPNLELQYRISQGHGTDILSPIGLIVFMHAGNQSELAGNPFGQGQPMPLRP
jgi:hypothetical protein